MANRGPSEAATSRRIVVGVDGSELSVHALRWAAGQAELTGAVVEAVSAWDIPSSFGVAPTVFSEDDFEAAAREALAAELQRVSADHPGVRMESRVMRGHPATVLLDRSEDADLLVVGSHGHGGFVGGLLGSVSQRCTQHATCPVVVVRPLADAGADT